VDEEYFKHYRNILPNKMKKTTKIMSQHNRLAWVELGTFPTRCRNV